MPEDVTQWRYPTSTFKWCLIDYNPEYSIHQTSDRRMNPKIAEEHAVRPYMAAQSRISEFAKSHDLKSRPHAMLWLSKVCGIPAGMYASQVRGTGYLSEGSEFGSQLQKRHLCSLRRILE